MSATPKATITICGHPSRATLAALLDLALSDGLALAVQPIAEPVPLQLPPAAVQRIRRKTRRVTRARTARPKAGPRAVPRAAPAPEVKSASRYSDKDCVTCGQPFTPSGPRSLTCDGCRESFSKDESRDAERRRLAARA